MPNPQANKARQLLFKKKALFNSARSAYISVVCERIFKIPFFSENCNELKIFLNIFFLSYLQPGQTRLIYAEMANNSAVYEWKSKNCAANPKNHEMAKK